MFNSIRDRIDAKVHGAQRLAKIVTSQQMKLNIGEFLKSKSRIFSFITFTGTYWYLLKHLRKSDSEIERLAGAGSLMVNFVELSFYFGDTINSKSKVCQESISFLKLLNNVLK